MYFGYVRNQAIALAISVLFFPLHALRLPESLNNLQQKLMNLGDALQKKMPSKDFTPTEKKVGPAGQSQEKTRKNFDPFEYVMGVSEDTFKDYNQTVKNSFFKDGKLINQKTKQEFAAGTFNTPSLAQLRDDFNKKLPGKKSTFNVIEGYERPEDSWFRHKLDSGALQADPANSGAVFQIASNFNGLEARGIPQSGVMIYLDNGYYVQGEASAVSAMPGAINRTNFIKHKVKGEENIGQLKNQVNFLQAFDGINFPHIPIDNGYITFNSLTEENRKKFNTLPLDTKNKWADNIHLGVHKDIQVTGGFGPKKSELKTYPLPYVYPGTQLNNPNQKITQVLTATANLAGKDRDAYEGLARLLLKAAYEGSIYAAGSTPKRKLFLTLVGGGVFQNKLSWIIDAIKEAITQSDLQNGGLNITLVVYDRTRYAPEEFQLAEKELFGLVKKSGGTWTRYKKDGVYQLE